MKASESIDKGRQSSIALDVRFGSRLCENSEVQIARRNSVSISLISEINCPANLCQRKAIENIFLLILGFRTFSHSLGQKASVGPPERHVRFTPGSGHAATAAPCPKSANCGHHAHAPSLYLRLLAP
jgi:hypothetical protein